jgi:hypothetical protein
MLGSGERIRFRRTGLSCFAPSPSRVSAFGDDHWARAARALLRPDVPSPRERSEFCVCEGTCLPSGARRTASRAPASTVSVPAQLLRFALVKPGDVPLRVTGIR